MSTDLAAGVIEGFYGPPWSWSARRTMVELLSTWGGNRYVWAPKSDPLHRDHWQEPFRTDDIDGFASLRGAGIGVHVGLTPGVDASPADVVAKLAPVEHVVDGFTLCFDDLDEHDAGRRHAVTANEVARVFGREVWLVPTHYAGTSLSGYLTSLIDDLDPRIEVMWTGSTVVCDEILESHATERTRVCGGRRPLVWDNTPVNDAMMRDLLHLGPYSGRAPGLRNLVSGVLVNPMESAWASRPTVRSAMAWVHDRDPIEEWRDELDHLGLGLLAEATAFAGDPHWPGHDPSREWWQAVASMPDTGDAWIDTWVESARTGAAIALEMIDIDGTGPDGAKAIVQAAFSWRSWRTRTGPSTLGRGPRIRPVFSQDESARFVARPGVAVNDPSLVDRVAERVLGRSR